MSNEIITDEILKNALNLLQKRLEENSGVLSTVQFKRAIVSDLHISEPDVINNLWIKIRYPNAEIEAVLQKMGIYHHGRSFNNKKKYVEAEEVLKNEADKKAQQVAKDIDAEQTATKGTESIEEIKRNRQEEARLGEFVMAELIDIYAPREDQDTLLNNGDEIEYVFDVHNERKGSSYQNVDLIAVHWRHKDIVDLITVEVKLDFIAQAVHQACNYRRFSHRVWIAVVVDFAGPEEAALQLRAKDEGLFEYTLSQGIGILACRRARGGRGGHYEIFPVHWPTWNNPELIERERFIERYRAIFEKAQVVVEKNKRPAAKF